MTCRNNPHVYVDKTREIEGFDLGNVSRARVIEVPHLPEVVPLIFHSASRERALAAPVVCLKLTDLVNFRTGEVRFISRDDLINAYKISPEARLILTGVDVDKRIEPLWVLEGGIRGAVRALCNLGVELITVPNFSVMLDVPRSNDLHAMKRIAILYSEIQDAGVACALHPNGRTEHDFERWSSFVEGREEVQVLAYEFITGTARQDRTLFHVDRLKLIAERCPRPLDLILRGNAKVIPSLQSYFRSVTYIDTSGFLKSTKRRRAERVGNRELHWRRTPTPVGAPIDDLMHHNVKERDLFLRMNYFHQLHPVSGVV